MTDRLVALAVLKVVQHRNVEESCCLVGEQDYLADYDFDRFAALVYFVVVDACRSFG